MAGVLRASLRYAGILRFLGGESSLCLLGVRVLAAPRLEKIKIHPILYLGPTQSSRWFCSATEAARREFFPHKNQTFSRNCATHLASSAMLWFEEVSRGSMRLNHPELVPSHPAHLVSPVKR